MARSDERNPLGAEVIPAQNTPLTDQQRLDIRKSMNGWSGDATAEIYEKGAIRAKAQIVSRELQDKQTSVLKKALKKASEQSSDGEI